MGTTGGFIALHRKILDWQWADDSNTFSTFVHLLLMANFDDTTYKGKEIKRGQIVTSLSSLGKKTGQTIQQTRTSLKHLILTGEITSETSNQNQVITIVNYDLYQTNDKRSNKRSTNDQHAEQQANQQRHNNINNINKETNKKESIGGNIPPTLDEVKTYIQENGFTVEPNRFFDYYESCGWVLNNGKKMKNWMATVRTWQGREKDGSRGQPVRSGAAHENDSGKNTSKYHDLPGVARV